LASTPEPQFKSYHYGRDESECPVKAGKEPFLGKKLAAVENCQRFLGQAERALFVNQYLTDPKLHIPDEEPYVKHTHTQVSDIQEGYGREDYGQLRHGRSEILKHYQEPQDSICPDALEEMHRQFQGFQEGYIKAYVDAHHRARGGEEFEPYEQLNRSRRYRLLKRLDQLEMISVEHNRRSLDQSLSSVLLHRCMRSPQDFLQAQPACSCGFRLGETSSENTPWPRLARSSRTGSGKRPFPRIPSCISWEGEKGSRLTGPRRRS